MNRGKIDPYQRIMAAYSIYDLLVSFFAYFLGPWMPPAAASYWSDVGNTAACSMQRFFYWFSGMGSLVSIFLNAVNC